MANPNDLLHLRHPCERELDVLTWFREDGEVIVRRGRHLDCDDKGEELRQLSEDRKTVKNEKEKKRGSHGHKRKIQAKAKQIVLSPLRQFDKHLAKTNKVFIESSIQQTRPPFPYDGEDFGGSPSCYRCFVQSYVPPLDLPIRLKAVDNSDAAKTSKPKPSDYYCFVKSLIEKNGFYSTDCNSHRAITTRPR
ncbi:hypothetical protein HPP92_026041 [Vanilla planifolia]|uniref:Uncharacterized protein n=1 Tax=Vanilla planifolia TaxID=51239 RepID=A0A835PL83_VANPL|nr:hypothetical protein HPP92_026041 [Vanilla planifolia]